MDLGWYAPESSDNEFRHSGGIVLARNREVRNGFLGLLFTTVFITDIQAIVLDDELPKSST
jgi:hypothetical protein